MGSRVFDVLGTLLMVALVTSLILPGRQTGTVITDSGNSLTKVIRGAMGLS